MGVQKQWAILTANGAEERALATIAKGLMAAKQQAKTISPENALLMTWSGKGWGISYPVDARLETSLGSDFDGLILPDGSRAVEKLFSNPHCKRFVNAFFLTNRPVVAFGTGADLLAKLGFAGENVAVFAETTEETLAQAAAHLQNHVSFADEAERVAA